MENTEIQKADEGFSLVKRIIGLGAYFTGYVLFAALVGKALLSIDISIIEQKPVALKVSAMSLFGSYIVFVVSFLLWVCAFSSKKLYAKVLSLAKCNTVLTFFLALIPLCVAVWYLLG